MSSLGRMFIAAVLDTGKVSELVQFGQIDHLFKSGEAEVYGFLREFVKKYQKLPTAQTLEKHTDEEVPSADEPPSYYYDLMQERYVEQELKLVMKKASDLLQPASKDPHGALGLLVDASMQLIAKRYNLQIMDFRHAHDMIMAEYAKEYNAEETDRLLTGWQTFDELANGFGKGDLISMIGRPGKGKTWSTLHSALHGWRDRPEKVKKDGKLVDVMIKGQSRMFVSMEMSQIAIQQRLAAMQTKVKYGNLDKAQLSTPAYKQLSKGLLEIQGFGEPFWVVDGNLTATVEDIYMIARQLKPHSIFIDGGYLLDHPTERDRYRKVAENATLMKKELAAMCPTYCSWQFAKTAAKKNKKKGEKADMEDIGYSDAIPQLSSCVLALLDKDSAESVNQRKIDILKGRKGEVGEFLINWDFGPNMDFSEVVEEDVNDLSF